ncbi:MAG: metalloregulator ArsR/SmtB family transcription factor [Erysipelotrichaceae bacterium]|nr:metalloregulator ArsR/SmtB family transcription factor [Erysipelotrichaceae bacterium]
MDKYEELMKEKAQLLKAIASPIRLCLIKKLYEQKYCNVTYFTDCMNTSQSNISQHLGKLRSMGIVGYQKEGQNVNYYLKDECVIKLVKGLFEDEK